MQGIIEFLFWTSVLLLAYAFLGYPALICFWAWLRPRQVSRQWWEPTVTLVVVAHNEAARIDARLANLTARKIRVPSGRGSVCTGATKN